MKVKQRLKTLISTTSFLAVLLVAACEQQGTLEMSAESSAISSESATVTELQIIDVVEGDGETASAGQLVKVHYTGWLYEPGAPENKGDKFDSSRDRNEPFAFPLGEGRVIQGWDQGFAGMQIGGQRVLIIPPHMGYGERGSGAAIPPNATLLFEVELLGIQ